MGEVMHPRGGPNHSATLILTKGVVGITIEPAFAGLGRSDHGMATNSCVFARVLVGRAVTTESYPAFLAGAEMDPVGPDPDAFGAFRLIR